jgi:hypothetical protein
LVNIMPATMMAGMKPHCTMGCSTITTTVGTGRTAVHAQQQQFVRHVS